MRGEYREQALTLVNHSLTIEQGDTVFIEAPPVAEPLIRAILRELAELGADWHVSMMSDRLRTAYLAALEDERIPELEATRAAVEAADAVCSIKGATNTAELEATPDEKMAAYEQATRPVQEAILETDWVLTQFPAPGDAQAANMSTDDYRTFVTDAVTLDWEAQHDFQQRVVDVLDPASEVRVQSDGTDVSFSVDGMNAGNEDGRKNLPGGEVGTAPIPGSVDGEIYFDLPNWVQGTTVEGARVTFADGKLVDYEAERGENALGTLFSTDDGAQRLGEFGIGMNRAITQPTRNALFDEKMGDTVHFAFGFSLPPTVGVNREGNESAVHQDMVLDMRETGQIVVDDGIMYRNGSFRWEDSVSE